MPDRDVDQYDLIVKAIEDYLSVRPHAADTIEGIARWWLSGDLQNASFEQIQHAVDKLCRRGVLHATQRSEQVIYQSTAAE